MKEKATNFYYILIVLSLIGTISCQNNPYQTKKASLNDTAKPIITTPVKNTLGVSCDTPIISPYFKYGAALAINIFKADTDKIKSLFLDKVILKIEKQKNAGGGMSDVYHFTDGINEVFMHYNDGFYIEDADIKNDRVLLNDKISFGMNKNDLLKLLKVTDRGCDTVTVTNDEYSFTNYFIFKNNKLKEIQMGQSVE